MVSLFEDVELYFSYWKTRNKLCFGYPDLLLLGWFEGVFMEISIDFGAYTLI